MTLLGLSPERLLPTAFDCPVCKAPSKLEIRNTEHLHCCGCHFAGNLVELYAAVHDIKVEEAIDTLYNDRLIDSDNIPELKVEFGYQGRLKAYVREQADYMKKGTPPAVNGILSKLGCRRHERTIQQLLPHICVLTKSHFMEAGFIDRETQKSIRPVLKWWGRYTALAIPAWQGTVIVGFWLLTNKGFNYLPVSARAAVGNGFAMVPSISDPTVFVVSDPTVALRYTIWSMLDAGRPTAFVVPHGLRDTAYHYRARRTVFWSPNNDPRWYLRALKSPTAQVLDADVMGPFDTENKYPCRGSFQQFLVKAKESKCAYEATAKRLLSLKLSEARDALIGMRLEPNDQSQVLAYASGADAERLANIFEESIPDRSVIWGNTTITDTPQGWMCKERIISSAKLHLEQIRPQGNSGDAIVVGSVVYNRRSYRFRESLDKMKNTGEWIQRFVVSKCGQIPYVETRWKMKLIEIAQQFHQPEAIMGSQQYGWDELKLRMPFFAVDAEGGVYPVQNTVDGPQMKLPPPLSDAEQEAFQSAPFCRLFLALLGNLVRTANGQPGAGIMLSGEHHIVDRVASVFGADVVSNPMRREIRECSHDPLPMFVHWDDHTMRRLIEMHGFKNVLISVDAHTSQLCCINPDWIRLEVGGAIDYQALRYVFLCLPAVLRTSVEIDKDTFYRDLADCVSAEFGAKNALLTGAMDLDTHSVYRPATAASRIMELIFYGMEKGEIEPRIHDAYVSIYFKEFEPAVSSPIISVPSIAELTRRLEDADFLVYHNLHKWDIARAAWDMNVSFLSV